MEAGDIAYITSFEKIQLSRKAIIGNTGHSIKIIKPITAKVFMQLLLQLNKQYLIYLKSISHTFTLDKIIEFYEKV